MIHCSKKIMTKNTQYINPSVVAHIVAFGLILFFLLFLQNTFCFGLSRAVSKCHELLLKYVYYTCTVIRVNIFSIYIYIYIPIWGII